MTDVVFETRTEEEFEVERRISSLVCLACLLTDTGGLAAGIEMKT